MPIFALWLLILTGCWDTKSIHDTNYIKAIGWDYRNDRYIIYAQMLDLSSVSKQQPGKINHNTDAWVGRAEGVTLNEAVTNLYKTSQIKVYWAHVSAFVFTEDALKQGVRSYIDGTTRFGETRYTQWVYGTKQSLDRLFTTAPFFNLSPLTSLLHNPMDNYKQSSFIRPLRLNEVYSDLQEPGYALLLPSLSVSEEAWQKSGDADPKLEIDGVFAVQRDKLTAWEPADRLDGLRWLERKSVRIPIVIYHDGNPSASIAVGSVRPTVRLVADGDKADFAIHLRCKAVINEIIEATDEEAVRQDAVKQIRKDIMETFAFGKKQNVDLYRLEHHLYWDRFPVWSKLTAGGSRSLQNYNLKSVNVDITIIHSGMNKLQSQVQEREQEY